jgi:hypothetical protein
MEWYPKQQALILKHGRRLDVMGHLNNRKVMNIKGNLSSYLHKN